MDEKLELYISLGIILGFLLTMFTYQFYSYKKQVSQQHPKSVLSKFQDKPVPRVQDFRSPARRYSLNKIAIEHVRKESYVSLIGGGSIYPIRKSSQVIPRCQIEFDNLNRLNELVATNQ